MTIDPWFERAVLAELALTGFQDRLDGAHAESETLAALYLLPDPWLAR